MSITELSEQILAVDTSTFESTALSVYRHQFEHTQIYRQYAELLKKTPDRVTQLNEIPFLPIRFFKSHSVFNGSPESMENILCFESSGTTGMESSKHYVRDPELYKRSFRKAFQQFFGEASQYCILALLPSYLERGQSSLVYMMNDLIHDSGHKQSGFYLHNHQDLYHVLQELEQQGQATLLWGVTYALLDFAAAYPMSLQYTQVIETGGMKGRRRELTRDEVHEELKQRWGLQAIASEYGMTELLSQAYATEGGRFTTPSWMQVMIRDEYDPFTLLTKGRGALNIIDLANLHSCSFLATDDLASIDEGGTFRILGRTDLSEMRGCSLLWL
jgi:phenylacetate-coenzyme A ligase PaaK-like adenylate-forming protein